MPLSTQLLTFSSPKRLPVIPPPAPVAAQRARFIARVNVNPIDNVNNSSSSTTPPGAFIGNATEWLSIATDLVREVSAAEAEVDALLRARIEASSISTSLSTGASASNDTNLPWAEIHSVTAQATRVAETERVVFANQLSALRSAARTNGGSPPASAIRALRDHSRRSFGVLRAEERAVETALASRAHVDAMAAAVSAERRKLPLNSVSAIVQQKFTVEQVQVKEEDDEEEEEGGGGEERGDSSSLNMDDSDDDDSAAIDDDNNNNTSPTQTTKLLASRLSPANAAASLRNRIAQLEAADARAAAGEGAAWDLRDAGSGGADDAALVASGVTRACRGEKGTRILEPGTENRISLLHLLCDLLPMRSDTAVDTQISFALAARARRLERLSVSKAWRALATDGAANPNDSSFVSGTSATAAASAANQKNNNWSGPDGLARVAAAEWRAAKRAEKEEARVAGELLAAATARATAAAREKRTDEARLALAEWRATGGGSGSGGMRGGTLSAVPPSPPRASLTPVDPAILRARAAVAIERAAIKRDITAKATAAAAAAATLRANGGADPFIARGERVAAARIRDGGENFGSAALPERSTTASLRAATSVRETTARAEVRKSATAHERTVASVRESAGRSFAVGSAGARPSRATPSWRKGL